jgi:hypothetical protein
MGDKPGSNQQRDIREWFSSPGSSTNGTPARRRRVMSTSDSEEERNMSSQKQPPPQQDIEINVGNQQDTGHQHANEIAPEEPDVIQLSSSSEDSTYLLLPTQQESGGAAPSARRNSRGMSAAARGKRKHGTGPRCNGEKRSKRSKPKFSAEAEETDATDDSSECDESEPDAQCLYRQAMNGVRNAGNARTNHRRATINCPVCAQFAAFLQHFLSN